MNPTKRRFYYDSTGHIFFETNAYGESTVEQEIIDFKQLSERNRSTFDVLELEYDEYKQDFAECDLVGVDIVTRKPIFALRTEDGQPPVILDKPLSEQIAEVKAANELLKIRDAGMQEDINFIYETLGG